MSCQERRLSVADVLRDTVSRLRLDHEQGKAVAHILACRTGRLGGRRAVCNRCGAEHYAYHSCRDRHCPRCGGLDQRLWAAAQLLHLLPVSYFHLVFTVPVSLRPFFFGENRRQALDALFAAVSETLLETADTLGLVPGILAVLHTWNQKLGDHPHPHLHCLVTGGGLGSVGFVHRRDYLIPLVIPQTVFKGKLLSKLQTLLRDAQTSVPNQAGHERLRDASRRTWNIDIRRPFGGPEQVVRYFARYVRKIAICDQRLVAYDGDQVSFNYRDRRDGNRVKTAELTALTFCQSFLRHVLPAGGQNFRNGCGQNCRNQQRAHVGPGSADIVGAQWELEGLTEGRGLTPEARGGRRDAAGRREEGRRSPEGKPRPGFRDIPVTRPWVRAPELRGRVDQEGESPLVVERPRGGGTAQAQGALQALAQTLNDRDRARSADGAEALSNSEAVQTVLKAPRRELVRLVVESDEKPGRPDQGI